MSKKKKKKSSGYAQRLSKQIKGLMLAEAFVIVRREHHVLRVNKIGDEQIQTPIENGDGLCISVDVVNGFVKRAWVS